MKTAIASLGRTAHFVNGWCVRRVQRGGAQTVAWELGLLHEPLSEDLEFDGVNAHAETVCAREQERYQLYATGNLLGGSACED